VTAAGAGAGTGIQALKRQKIKLPSGVPAESTFTKTPAGGTAAGPELAKECGLLGGCKTGDAVATSGYRLPATYIIHAVGPVWQGGSASEDDLLASCYRRALEVADQLHVKSIAFPAISTGIYGFPKQRAAQIAVTAIREYTGGIERLIFACFDSETADIYRGLLKDLDERV
jgi:O-acetyl-ADP-ribose deacetylase (regulator of RNase III)